MGDEAEVVVLLRTLSGIAAAGPQILALRINQSALAFLGAELRRGSRAPRLRREMLSRARACRHGMRELGRALAGLANPFAAKRREDGANGGESGGGVTLADFVIEQVPREQSWRGVSAIYQATGAVIQRYVYLHFRLLGALAVIAEEVEAEAGLERLAAPPAVGGTG